MPTWNEALSFAMTQTSSAKRTAAGYPQLDNREASGLILFARDVAAYARKQGIPFDLDWYALALPALGWSKPGDKFVMTVPHQLSAYAASSALWTVLGELARKLDAAGVAFKMVRDPAGTSATYQQLASAAWARMKAESPQLASKAKGASTSSSSAASTEQSDSQGGGSGGAILLLLAGLALMMDD